MLKAAREGGITEKFGEWIHLGYVDKAKMTTNLIATREAKEREAKSKAAAEKEPESTGGLTGEPSEKVTEKGADDNDILAESYEDEEEDGRET
ncbi:hypothetical protein ACLB2K_022227 [Fragaria x ananassa]